MNQPPPPHGGAGGWEGGTYGSPGHPGHGPGGYPPPPGGGHAPGSGPYAQGPPVLADWGQRFAARLIDVIIAQVVAVGVLIPAMIVIFPLVGPGRGEMVMFLILALFFLVYWGYEVICTRRFEATPGKRMMNLRVVGAGSGGTSGGPPEPAIMIRGAVWAAPLLFSWGVLINLLSGVFWLVNVLWPLWDQPNRQALHDKAAGTVVVRLR